MLVGGCISPQKSKICNGKDRSVSARIYSASKIRRNKSDYLKRAVSKGELWLPFLMKKFQLGNMNVRKMFFFIKTKSIRAFFL